MDRRGILAPSLLRHPDRHHGSVETEPEQSAIRIHPITGQRRYLLAGLNKADQAKCLREKGGPRRLKMKSK